MSPPSSVLKSIPSKKPAASSAYSSALKMEAKCSSESLDYTALHSQKIELFNVLNFVSFGIIKNTEERTRCNL
jgi:hypothetical protein